MDILYVVSPEVDYIAVEVDVIAKCLAEGHPLLNATEGTQRGLKLSKQHRERISASLRRIGYAPTPQAHAALAKRNAQRKM
jgi:hypothetical protein